MRATSALGSPPPRRPAHCPRKPEPATGISGLRHSHEARLGHTGGASEDWGHNCVKRRIILMAAGADGRVREALCGLQFDDKDDHLCLLTWFLTNAVSWADEAEMSRLATCGDDQATP